MIIQQEVAHNIPKLSSVFFKSVRIIYCLKMIT